MAKIVAFDWNLLLEKISKEQCLLVLGPEVFCAPKRRPYQDRLVHFLDAFKKHHHHTRHYEEGFFFFDEPENRTSTCHAIKRFYKYVSPPAHLSHLAEVPFHVALTVTPDQLLHRAFDDANFPYQAGFYKKNLEPQEIKKATKQNPLLYNMFGCIESEESMVLTHSDLYDYFKSIFARKSMPQLLKDQLKEVKYILFLGVPFDKWYMQLLLRELEIHRRELDFIRHAINQTMSDEIRTLCVEQFKINFIPKNDIIEFIGELNHRCHDAKPTKLIRQPRVAKRSIKEEVEKLIKEVKIEDAIDLLVDAAEGTDLQDDAVQLAVRYHRFKRRESSGMLRPEEQDFQFNNIIAEILELAKLIEKLK